MVSSYIFFRAIVKKRLKVYLNSVRGAPEAFVAHETGADLAKLFPGELMSPAGIRALSAVLPKSLRLLLVGGVGLETAEHYRETPLAGMGIGSSLYKPGVSAGEVGSRASHFVESWRKVHPR
jgi:2-dehydro-3-deoxyphosphogalactonate aldolase